MREARDAKSVTDVTVSGRSCDWGAHAEASAYYGITPKPSAPERFVLGVRVSGTIRPLVRALRALKASTWNGSSSALRFKGVDLRRPRNGSSSALRFKGVGLRRPRNGSPSALRFKGVDLRAPGRSPPLIKGAQAVAALNSERPGGRRP